MPMKLFYRDDGGVMVTGEGVITGKDIKDLNRQLYESPQKIKDIKYQICDFSQVEGFDLSTQDVRDIAQQDNYASGINPNMIIALVGSKDIAFGLSRMWEFFTTSSPLESMVFRKLEPAEKWIKEKLKSSGDDLQE